MPKKVVISLHAIVKQIDLAVKKLAAAEAKAVTAQEKKVLAAKIKSLDKIKAQVKSNCPKSAYGIVALVK
jgi:hypothetical protein